MLVNARHFLDLPARKLGYMCFSDGDCTSGRDVMRKLPASDGGRSPLRRILISLQDAHRRYLLYHLQAEDGSDLEHAARCVAAWDHECDPADVPTDLHDRIKAELYHSHLPKLADLNIVDYDERSGTIRLRDPPNKLDDFLDLTRIEDDIG